jgi:hypothetical protein
VLIIRQSQIEAFELAALQRFENDMVAHLNAFAPKHCEVIGEPAVRTGISLGIGRARRYGLTNRGPMRFYIELMFMYGCDFDSDPQCVWASDVLQSKDFPDQMARADQLYENAIAFTDKTAGRNYIYAKDALRRVHRMKFEDLPLLDEAFDTTMLDRLTGIHPEKIQVLGETGTKTVIEHGKKLPATLSLAPERGAALCVGAAFALGHGFGHDPLLPWIAHTVTNPLISDPGARTKRLYARIMTYLDHIIAGFDGWVGRP